LQDSDITTELNASSVVALLDHLDVTSATLVMHDWSGGHK
jgi:pimeloyl-ACP methyl ester carboxylesterase